MNTSEMNSVSQKINNVQHVIDGHNISINDNTIDLFSNIRHKYMDSEFISEGSNESEYSMPQIKYGESESESKLESESKASILISQFSLNESNVASDVISDVTSNVAHNNTSNVTHNVITESSMSGKLFVKNPNHMDIKNKHNAKHKKIKKNKK
jgi:hypothetical protein